MPWLKNTSGKPDSMFTFAVGGFFVTVLILILSAISTIEVGDVKLELRTPDTTLATAFLGATLLAYVNRRNKKEELEHTMKIQKLRAENGVLD